MSARRYIRARKPYFSRNLLRLLLSPDGLRQSKKRGKGPRTIFTERRIKWSEEAAYKLRCLCHGKAILICTCCALRSCCPMERGAIVRMHPGQARLRCFPFLPGVCERTHRSLKKTTSLRLLRR